MNVIAVGYSGTGSSAILHLLSEYQGFDIAIKGSYEHVLFYIPDGLFDLEDRILRNNSIHMFDGAINRFYSAMKRLNDNDFGWFGGYKRKYGNQFMQIVDCFIEEITQYKFEGYWSDDFCYRASVKALLKDSVKKLCGKETGKYGYNLDRFGDGIVRYSFITSDQFYISAKKFVKSYCDMIRMGRKESLLWDQLILPQNLYRLDQYFEDTKVIVFDRDPRDMYVLSKYVWPTIVNSAHLFPTNPKEFVDYYKSLKNSELPYTGSNVLRLHFEDLIYQYEITVRKIEEFLEIAPVYHTKVQEVFKPDVSIKNTQNFRMKPSWIDEVQIIEEQMVNEIYPFPYVITNKMSETSDPS